MKYLKEFESINEDGEPNKPYIIPHRGRKDIINSPLIRIDSYIDTDGTDIVNLVFEGGVLMIVGDDIDGDIVSNEYYDRNHNQ
jgi:hypothetical protein